MAGLILVTVVLPRAGAASSYVVLTGSMRPSLPPGTLVVVRRVPADEIRVGDVITYQLASGKPDVVTHRVVSQGLDGRGQTVLRTRGDANPVPDARWVHPVQVRGREWYAVPYVGRLVSLLTVRQHQLLDVAVALGLLAYAGRMFHGAWRDRRRKQAGLLPELEGTRA